MDLAHALHDLVFAMDRRAAALLGPLGLTLRQHTALVVIGEHPGLRGRDLARALGVTAAAATGIVAGLMTRGWVADQAPPGSGHRQALHLTQTGAATLAESTAALGEPFDELVRSCGHDPAGLAATLRGIKAALDG